MLYSVIIPAYNCIDTLKNTVESILNSGLFDFEVLIIDDGSTDGTTELCDLLVKDKREIRCIHQQNAGVSTARNVGIEMAQGEYLLFFDSDDTVDEGTLKHAAELVYQTKPDMMIFGLTFDYYLHGKMYRRDSFVYSKEVLLNREQWSYEFMDLYICNALSPVWNKFIRRSILMEYQVRFHKDLIEMEDFLFVVCCMTYCENIYVLPEAIYHYRQAEDEKSTFHRLLKIHSLSVYMQSFETEIDTLVSSVSLTGEIAENVKGVTEQIYVSLFREQIYFGDIVEIRRASSDMLTGKYSEAIQASDSRLYCLLEQGKYRRVWMRSVKMRLRHWGAVRVKYVRSCWRI